MARSALTLWRRERGFDPDAAPHTSLVRDLLRAQLPAIHRRLRGAEIDLLTRRFVSIERSPSPLVDESTDGQLVLVALRLGQVLQQLQVEERSASRAFASFSQMISRAQTEEERRQVLTEYLIETVTDSSRLRGDLRALDRFLGADALRERHGRSELSLSVQAELSLLWLASGFAQLKTIGGDEARDRLRRAGLGTVLLDQLVDARRWQVRWAAGRALAAWVRFDSQAPVATASLEAVAGNRDEHPWVQACALEALVQLEPASARQRLEARLLSPSGGRDAFLRKLALGLAFTCYPQVEFAELLRRIVTSSDPSEHVRLAIAELSTRMAWKAAAPVLLSLASGAGSSGKVRGAAAQAARTFAVKGPSEVTAQASEYLCKLVGDGAPYPAMVACDELTAVATALGESDRELLIRLAPQWLEALAERITDSATTPQVAEYACAAAEAIDREVNATRRALTQAVRRSLERVAPGRSTTIELTIPPADAGPSDATIARVLADISRRDWGVSATRKGNRLKVWRGDRFRRRLWRVLHELRTPLPNKRQAWVHTVGRTYPGALRAHPGLLEEATATTVPGERVNVDSEGSWGRHLPSVDDALDLPLWRPRPVQVVSSAGTVRLTPPSRLIQRLRNRFLISLRYRRLVALRLSSLRALKDPQRRRYTELLSAVYGITAEFEPHRHDSGGRSLAPIAADTADLFVQPDSAAMMSPPTALALAPVFTTLVDWYEKNRGYFASVNQNSQAALVLFASTLAAVFWTRSWHKRQQITRARSSIPLSIGGWGTRGKSGTERLKAGLLDGLGFEVFVKTTGCEAMFIHSAPMQQPVEIFIYRPYDKATIWEQMVMVMLGSRLGCDVFLWECMALNPKYVQLLQHDWMRDDLVTLTNCYPDHEDIQGPAGFNVANVITEFIPTKSTLITSETSYLPLFTQVCQQRHTKMYTVGDREAELIGDDVLELFPYREHPRNIALVERVAMELGIDRDLALLTMAENVVPDLGVLKAYPPCRVRGRVLTFLCGNSANERTGFINNWRRTRLDKLDLESEPHRLVITVVNNRADRIARSEVFARILVRDIDCDRHVLIGTNLKGLRGFIDAALDDYLAEVVLVEPEELVKGDVPTVVAQRFWRELAKLRIPRVSVDAAMARLALYGKGAGLLIAEDNAPELRQQITAKLAESGPLQLDEVRRAIEADKAFLTLVDNSLRDAPAGDVDDLPETLEPATRDEVVRHFVFELARLQIRSRLETQLAALFADPSPEARVRFARDTAAAYRTMFLAQVDVVEDSGATGDQIIERCARCVPPGSDVTLMGTQNIKGTGLDFVYRWLALDKVVTTLREQRSPRLDRRLAALTELEAFEDHGLVDTGLARELLSRPPEVTITNEETEARARIKAKVDAIWARRKAALVEQKKAGWVERVALWAEAWVDWIDSARRGRQAAQIVDDLVDARISHQRAAVEMRKIVGRLKGGWLIKSFRRK